MSSLKESQISVDKILILDPAISNKLEQYIFVFCRSGIIHFHGNTVLGIIVSPPITPTGIPVTTVAADFEPMACRSHNIT